MKLFDLHCDTLTECEKQGLSLFSNTLHWDMKRATELFESALQVTAVYISDDMSEQDAWEYFHRILSFFRQQEVAQIQRLRDLDLHSHGVLLAVENSKLLGEDLSRLSVLAQMGVMYMTLTWNGANQLGNGCLSGIADGLTSLGKQAVAEMYRLGIYPDVSHLNEMGFWDVAAIADGRPFLATHSDSACIHPHPRNLTDAQFQEIVRCKGLVGLNICADHLGGQTFEKIEKHLVHYWELGGEKIMAMGLDLDGTPLQNWNGIEFVPHLYEYLLMKGYRETVIRELFYENCQSFFAKTLTSREKCIRIRT